MTEPPGPPGGLGSSAALFLDWLPALVLATVCLRAAELYAGLAPGGGAPAVISAATSAAAQDLLALARYLPGLFLGSLPLLLLPSRRLRFPAVGLAWSVLVLIQAALVQYFLTARVPLGADLFAYSGQEIRTTVAGGATLNLPVLAGVALALIVLWAVLARQSRRPTPALSPRTAALMLAASVLVLIAAPARPGGAGPESEDARNLALNKTAFFLDDSVAYLSPRTPGREQALPAALAAAEPAADGAPGNDPGASAGFRYLDPAYPFLRAEQTADVLGPHFDRRPGPPPNIVIIIVEGLGRAFSGPDASLGSFTPRLDELAGKSLYFENFLAPQGRTFAALSSILGSLPFGDNGFAMLGRKMPPHASLPRVLKQNGYRLKFYCGTDPDFDNERLFLERQGMDLVLGEDNFGPKYPRSGYWGYADQELLTRVLEAESRDTAQPFLSVIQTITMHTPYTFPGQARFDAVFEKRLDELRVADYRKDAYRANRKIYTSILYADEALGRFFEQARSTPAFGNTIFVVTGDHRLPEIPMDTRIERYHVPLIIHSPLLKAPARIRSVSSQFDLAPSLLAFLARNHGIRTPPAVTWLGAGLDMEPGFRNIHDLALKQTKTNLVDYVSGTWFLNQNTLYEMSDGMHIEPVNDPVALARVEARFAAFRRANEQFARSLSLVPDSAIGQLVAYDETTRVRPPAMVAGNAPVLAVGEVTAPADAVAGKLTIRAVFANPATVATDTFVPLVILLTGDGREVTESYGAPQRLAAGASVSLDLAVTTGDVTPGEYFLSVLPSHPDTGKKMGVGRYRIPIRLGS